MLGLERCVVKLLQLLLLLRDLGRRIADLVAELLLFFCEIFGGLTSVIGRLRRDAELDRVVVQLSRRRSNGRRDRLPRLLTGLREIAERLLESFEVSVKE